MNPDYTYAMEFLLRNAAAGYSIAVLLFIAIASLSPGLRRISSAAFRSFIVTGVLIALCYPVVHVGFFLTGRQEVPIFRIVRAILTVPVHAWVRAAFLICLLVPLVALITWRRKPIVGALLLIPAVNADWIIRVLEARANIAAVGCLTGSWYEDRTYTSYFPTSMSFGFAVLILALCLLSGFAVQRRRLS